MKKSPRISGVGLMPAYTLASYLSRLKKKMAQRYTHTLGSRALRLTFLQDYFTIRIITHSLSSFPIKDLLSQVFFILAMFLFSFLPCQLFLYDILNPPAK